LVGQQEGHLTCKKYEGWWRWALVIIIINNELIIVTLNIKNVAGALYKVT